MKTYSFEIETWSQAMTKKSFARQQRDAEKKQLEDNRCWDELNQIYESSRVMLFQHNIINELASNEALRSCLPDPASTANHLRILSRDLKALNDQLSAIHAQHVGRTGGSQDPDVVWGTIVIGQEYAKLVDTHTAVVQPTVFKILEDFGEAEKKLKSLQMQAANLANRNTDIVDVSPTTH